MGRGVDFSDWFSSEMNVFIDERRDEWMLEKGAFRGKKGVKRWWSWGWGTRKQEKQRDINERER